MYASQTGKNATEIGGEEKREVIDRMSLEIQYEEHCVIHDTNNGEEKGNDADRPGQWMLMKQAAAGGSPTVSMSEARDPGRRHSLNSA
jgi:hypothetical protein